MNNLNYLPPYPRLGECYRALAVALDTKASNRDIDRLAREGDFDSLLLESIREEIILHPLKKHTDLEFAKLIHQWLAYVQTHYLELVASVSLDGLNRAEAFPLLLTHFFIPHAVALIMNVQKELDGPELTQLLDHNKNPLAVVFEWYSKGDTRSLIKLAFPCTTGTDRTDSEMVQKWMQGTDLPKLSSITRFTIALEKNNTNSTSEETRGLRRWLLIARALICLEKNAQIPLRHSMLQYQLLGMPDPDVHFVLSMAVISTGEKYSALKLPALRLYEALKRATAKKPGEQSRTKNALEELDQLVDQHDPEGNTRFHIEWMKGRWHALSGQFAEALLHYEKAVELGCYRSGELHKPILEEALVLAAYLHKKPSLNRLKHRAIAAGLFSSPNGKSIIEEWEIGQIRQQFHQVFPKFGRFQETVDLQNEKIELGSLLLTRENLEKCRPDLGTPDRERMIYFSNGQKRRWTQLRLFAWQGKTTETKALLQRGASVDKLDEAGASALLCALQHATQTGNRQTLDLLLQVPHQKTTLDSITAKKQLSCLFCAIDYGEPDVVEALLKMGASPDQRGNIVNQTPLYYVMEMLASILHPARFLDHLLASLSTDPDAMRSEAMRRYNVSYAGVFGSDKGVDAIKGNSRQLQIFVELANTIQQERLRRHKPDKLFQITELLLKHGATPNAPHSHPVDGRTPLMLAVEVDIPATFDLMLRHGGDPYLKDSEGMDCPKLAMGFGAAGVVSEMRRKKIL